MYANHFSLVNIPFGIGSSESHPLKSAVTRVGDTVIFLNKLVETGLLSGYSPELVDTLSQPTLNSLAALPKSQHQKLRLQIQQVLKNGNQDLPIDTNEDVENVTLHLPIDVRGFTDFSCSKEHVLNAGEAIMKKRLLPPGFLHFPIGYTGRASSIVVSGTQIVRPKGQYRDGEEVIYGPSKQLDYELEVGAVIGKPSKLGETISVENADDHIFGLVLINDWSARDIQGLEMSPLGPMNGKSFGTSMSPWIITLDALKSSEISAPTKDIPAVSYLDDKKPKATYDIHLQAELIAAEDSSTATTVCRSELKWMYWSLRDLVSQQTCNGCNINTGDVLATGTISGSTEDSHGCLLELTKGGEKAFVLEGGAPRMYLKDGDAIRLTASAGDGVGFGECIGRIVSAT